MKTMQQLEEEVLAGGYGDLGDGPQEEDKTPLVTDEEVAELNAAIEKFNEEQASVLISPEQAHKMIRGWQEGGPAPAWREKLTGRERDVLDGCVEYSGWGSPGHHLILLVNKLAKLLDEGV